MKQFIKSILLFVLILLVFYPILVCIWGLVMPSFLKPNLNYYLGGYGHMYSRLNEAKKIKKVDCLIIGSSLAYRGFDTRILNDSGISSFNLGSSSQTPLQTKVLLKKYLTRLSPNRIIYVVDPDAFTSDGVESSLDLISNDRNDINTIKMAIAVHHIKVFNTLIFACMRDALKLNNKFAEPVCKDDDIYINGGYVEKKISYFKNVTYPVQRWKFNPKQLKSFSENISIIKSMRIPYILVNTPVTTALYKSYTNNNEFDSIMNAYGRYYNFNGKIKLNDSLDFYDEVHLNQEGVRKFDSSLIKLLDSVFTAVPFFNE